jgi:hypothetical protein
MAFIVAPGCVPPWNLVRFPIALLALAASPYGPARVLVELQNPAIRESSGMAASRRYPGVFWTHNDSGDVARVFAFDREGRDRGVFHVRGAANIDWEDMAIGPGPEKGAWYLYVAEIGGNKRVAAEVLVYRVKEPAPRPGVQQTEAAFAIRLRYPDGPHDAEALLVHPVSGDLYIITKATVKDADTWVFKAAAPHTEKTRTLEKIARLRLPGESPLHLILGLVTGGDISPDGRRAAICDYHRAYEAELPSGRPFDDIWTQAWTPIELAPRRQGESLCYRHDGKALLATSEGAPCRLQETVRRSP